VFVKEGSDFTGENLMAGEKAINHATQSIRSAAGVTSSPRTCSGDM
jgi:hypothetical protein